MIDELAKAHLHGKVHAVCEALVWKLEGLSEYDVRRPLTSTGTNLLDLYRRVWIHADATIEALDLDSRGYVPWWDEEVPFAIAQRGR